MKSVHLFGDFSPPFPEQLFPHTGLAVSNLPEGRFPQAGIITSESAAEKFHKKASVCVGKSFRETATAFFISRISVDAIQAGESKYSPAWISRFFKWYHILPQVSARYRNVTACARVQTSAGLNVFALVPVVIPFAVAHAAASA